MPDAHVFLSYAAEDRVMASSVYARLADAGISVWMDTMNLLPGQSWEGEIVRAIRTSRLFLTCLSERAVAKRGFVQSELKRALKILETVPSSEVFIIPVRFDSCSIPTELEAYQWLDYFAPDGPERLVKAVLNHLGLEPKTSGSQVLIAERPVSRWIGGGAVAKIGSNQHIPFARIFDPAQRHPGAFSGDACAVRFAIAARVDWATVTGVFARVYRYEAPPKYEPIFPAPYESAHVYYVEIDKPDRDGGTNVFEARYWGEKGPTDLGAVVLKRGVPEVFVLRVNARRPGVYGFSCEIEIGSPAGSQTLDIATSEQYLFDDAEGVCRAYYASRTI